MIKPGSCKLKRAGWNESNTEKLEKRSVWLHMVMELLFLSPLKFCAFTYPTVVQQEEKKQSVKVLSL